MLSSSAEFKLFYYLDWHFRPNPMSLKITFQIASLCGLIIYTALLSTLVSKFSVHMRELNTFQDLIVNNYTLYYYKNSVSMKSFVNVSALLNL